LNYCKYIILKINLNSKNKLQKKALLPEIVLLKFRICKPATYGDSSGEPVIKDQITEAPFHVLVIVGGKLSSSNAYLYMIDPNNGYNCKTKSSVYRVDYHAIKNYFTAFDKGLFVPEEGNSAPHPLAINYFIYGKNSLKLTRDFEDNSVEDEILERSLKKYKK